MVMKSLYESLTSSALLLLCLSQPLAYWSQKEVTHSCTFSHNFHFLPHVGHCSRQIIGFCVHTATATGQIMVFLHCHQEQLFHHRLV